MSRRLTRISLALVFLLSSEVWAIGLGDIQLDSALNEPLRAEIELLSAAPEELSGLTVVLASAETFERYGIDRPYYLQEIVFRVESGPAGHVIQVRSPSPITEPFLTFLVEASWSAGRLVREYTVLLDPPTYSPPALQQTPAVEAPRRATTTDSARIERQAPAPEPEPEPEPAYTPPSRPAETPSYEESQAPSYEETPAYDDTPSYEAAPPAAAETPAPDDTSSYEETPSSATTGGDYYVARGDTLWGITTRLRPDSRLTMNQTMIAIFEANPQAFDGNINRLKAGAMLRIPSADDIFQIGRGDAFNAVRTMNNEWLGDEPAADPTYLDTSYDDTAYQDESQADATDVDAIYDAGAEETAAPETETSLTLVPPDEEPAGIGYDDLDSADAVDREQAIVDRIAELEAADVPDQQSLIEIRDNELAALRQELAEIRGEVYEPPMPVEPAPADEIQADEVAAEADEAEAEPQAPTEIVRTPRVSEPGILDRVQTMFGSIWTKIIAGLILVGAIILWFLRRGSDEGDESAWDTLDDDEAAAEPLTATETMHAPSREESIVVVEEESGIRPLSEDTVEVPLPDMSGIAAPIEESGQFGSLEDTFSSDTAVNLDQSDPIAEADFHMAYGLYDQAAELVTGALQSDPSDTALMVKLCEIYFVWGNRDAFVDAATNLKALTGEAESVEWDKIVIMGQQIAADHELFAGAELAGATKAVDLSFEAEMDQAADLDMDFGAAETEDTEVLDLGAEVSDAEADDGLDFLIEGDETTEAPTAEMLREEPTARMSVVEDLDELSAADDHEEMPVVEDLDELSAADDHEEMPAAEDLDELPAAEDLDEIVVAEELDEISAADVPVEPTESLEQIGEVPAGSDHTADIPALAGWLSRMDGNSELPALDDAIETAAVDGGQEDTERTVEINLEDLDLDIDDLDDLGTTEMPELAADVTGKNPAIDPDATGVQRALDPDATDLAADFDFDDIGSTGLRLAPDETGRMPSLDALDETEALLDETIATQVLGDDLAVELSDELDAAIGDDDATLLAPRGDDEETDVAEDAETLLAPLDDDLDEDFDEDLDYSRTEALPQAVFTDDAPGDETTEMPVLDLDDSEIDLDLDDLTAALEASESDDKSEHLYDDKTVEQPRPSVDEESTDSATIALSPEDMSDDLLDARTMTEVGTKLDLARAYVDMGDPAGARSILEEVLDEGDEGERQQAQQLLDSLPS